MNKRGGLRRKAFSFIEKLEIPNKYRKEYKIKQEIVRVKDIITNEFFIKENYFTNLLYSE